MDMFQLQINHIEKLSKEFTIIPISKEIFSDIITPIQALKAVKNISSKCYLLESVEGGEKWDRYSFIGFDPITEIICKNGNVYLDNKKLEPNNSNEIIKLVVI